MSVIFVVRAAPVTGWAQRSLITKALENSARLLSDLL